MSVAIAVRSEARPGQMAVDRDAIARRVRELAGAIAADHAGSEPVLLAAAGGAVVFLSDLSRALAIPHVIELVAVTPFRAGGPLEPLRLVKDVDRPLAERSVIVVEDALDTGLRMRWLVGQVTVRGAASVHACALLDRPERRLVGDLPLSYVGFDVAGDEYVGYGLGHRGRFRQLPDLHVLVH
jgi:hypoxanthine phosphoribosyltransferase